MKTANSLKLAVFFCLVVEPQEYARHLRLAIAEQVNTKAFDWRNTNQIRLVKYIPLHFMITITQIVALIGGPRVQHREGRHLICGAAAP